MASGRARSSKDNESATSSPWGVVMGALVTAGAVTPGMLTLPVTGKLGNSGRGRLVGVEAVVVVVVV